MSREKAAAIVVMVKAPRPGAVKTRLTPGFTAQAAAEFAACCARDVVAAARKVTPAVLIAYAPHDARSEMEALLVPSEGLRWTAQQGADLGARMYHAAAFARTALNAGPIMLLGTDSPTFPPDAVTSAFALLETHDLVLGPADDGGYWCVGLRDPVPNLFDGITWSTETVFAQTVEIARRHGLSVATVASWYDVDTLADIARLRADPALSHRAPITHAWMRAQAGHRRTSA